MRSEFLAFSPPFIGDEEIDEVVSTLRTPWISTGPKTQQFEEDFATYIGAPSALAVSSCTDAMLIALAALGVGKGDAVFAPTMTFAATINVIEHLGAEAILVDCDTATLNMNTVELARTIERTVEEGHLKPTVIMPVHYSGRPVDMAPVVDLAKRYSMAIVEDAAHALPATYADRLIGSPIEGVTWATAFSFYATKNLCTAEGGMLTGTPDLLEEAALWRLHGMSRDAWNRYGKGGSWYYEIVRPGFKCNMTDIQAAMGIHQLQKLNWFQENRKRVVDAYNSAFDGHPSLQTPAKDDEVSNSAWHLYPLRLQLDQFSIDRAAFIDQLTERNIGSSVHFIPIHFHPWFQKHYGLTESSFPVAEAQFHRLVSLPLHPALSDDDVKDVTDAVLEIAEVFSADSDSSSVEA
ncbi:MAG: DegT/DnrJ/EryC1/StrS aminotransferase family protein [Microthrixaceae bacterium]|nr:DegT/DnrJ/EryC1/StrS aminotransferase family protein [Microthrixaceae bacterium]